MSWVSVRVRAPEAERPAVIGVLFDLGSQGVHEDGDAIVTHFPAPLREDALLTEIHGVSASAIVETAIATDVDWSERWRDRIERHDLGRLIVAPPWLAADAEAARTVVIDPGMAFGTGDHPTTRGVVRLMGRVVTPGATVADLGAGSAVLSIAAAKLGARAVMAIELDPEAISNAEANVVRNEVTDRVTVLQGDAESLLRLVAPVDVVVVNIISSVIASLLPRIADSIAPGGAVVIGGVLVTEHGEVSARLVRAGWRIVAEDIEGEWWSATARRV